MVPAFFPPTRPRLTVRAPLTAIAGLTAIFVGITRHVAPVAMGTAGVLDYAGVLVAVMGVVLVGVAFRLALAGRPTGAKLLAVPAVLILLQWFVAPMLSAAIISNTPRPDVASAGSLGLQGARDVTFPSGDGVRLAGWYAPGRNGAAVILLHGSHGTRSDARAHLRLVARAGYAVLAFDARGHGASSGRTNALGWRGEEDLAGAVAFLHRQPEVDASRVAALGLSMGGEEALRAAAAGVPLRGVIADGAGASTAADSALLETGATAPVARSVTWLTMRATELLTGEDEPPPLEDVARRISVPVLLIASNARGELALDRRYSEQIGARATLWHVGDAGHTEALRRHPHAYAERVTAWLAETLG